jgi:hypothetical protein
VGWFLRFAHSFSSGFLLLQLKRQNLIEEKKGGDSKNRTVSLVLLPILPRRLLQSTSSSPWPSPPCFSTQLLFFDDSTVLRPARSSSLRVFSLAREKNIPKAPSLTRRPAAAEIRHEAVASNLPRLGRNYVAELLCRRGSAWNRTKGAQIGEFGREGPKGTLPTCLTKPRAASPAMVVARL